MSFSVYILIKLLLLSDIAFKMFEFSFKKILKLFITEKLLLLVKNNKELKIMYVNNIPYTAPKNLSKIRPRICLSKSLFKIFLILFNKNKLIRNINGIEIIKLIVETNCLKSDKNSIFKSKL